MQRLRASLPPDTRYFASARCPKSSWDLAKHAHLHLLCTTEARQGYDDTKQGGKPTRLGTITPGHNNGAEIHLPKKRNRRRRGMGRLMHSQCIRCRPVQTHIYTGHAASYSDLTEISSRMRTGVIDSQFFFRLRLEKHKII